MEQQAQANRIRHLLDDAGRALEANRLMRPAGDNAYAYYQQVLALDSLNTEARLGIKRIGRRYLVLANDAASEGDLAGARQYVAQAREIDPDYPAVAHMEQYLDHLARQRRAAAPRPAAKPAPAVAAEDSQTDTPSKPVLLAGEKPGEYRLDAAALTARNRPMTQALQQLAREVKQRDSRFEIVARSDAEGRWIYQTMRDGVSEYRLRANLKRGQSPRILLLD